MAKWDSGVRRWRDGRGRFTKAGARMGAMDLPDFSARPTAATTARLNATSPEAAALMGTDELRMLHHRLGTRLPKAATREQLFSALPSVRRGRGR